MITAKEASQLTLENKNKSLEEKVKGLLAWFDDYIKKTAEKGNREVSVNLLDLGLKGLDYAPEARDKVVLELGMAGYTVHYPTPYNKGHGRESYQVKISWSEV